MIQIGNKRISGIYIKKGIEIKRLMLKKKEENQLRDFIIYTLQKSLEYQFNESTSSNRSNTFTLDNLISIDEISVDNGNVTYNINGNKVTVNVSGGSSRSEYDSSKYSKSVSDYKTSSNDSFPSNMSYSLGGYSGTIYKDGSSYVSGGSYTPSDSMVVKIFRTYHMIIENGQKIQSFPIEVPYNEDGYRGTLKASQESHGYDYDKLTDALIHHTSASGTIGMYYMGTVTRQASDTRVYRQNYRGYVYKGGYNYYYKYKINMKYTIKN